MFIHTYTQKNYDAQEPEIARWYVAAFTTPKNYYDIAKWCYNTFGEPGFIHNTQRTRWADDIHYGEIYFSNEEDLLMFILRWS